MSVLVEHIAALRKQFIAEHRKAPTVLALGRWDARELVREVHRYNIGASFMTPRRILREARAGMTAWGADVKVDGRIGRMPGALWWHA